MLPLYKLESLIESAGFMKEEIGKVVDFLLYYGVIGLHTENADFYIYNVSYDPKMLKIRVQQAGSSAIFIINPAFWPALGTRQSA